ncbi:response regulator [Hymenobacter jejuensis]|uniref:Response regulator n=1 Tax=Hymenobacter jejuensis TaxID=2502781 RepID=A0A5B7ZW87_9BACT|nr:response regulator [Hymenobacter jejuensis]QDA58786.1 response regulator [Hymenobacter jejuensis]
MHTYLIDDDEIGVYLTEQLLRLENFSDTISTFFSAQEALGALQRRLPAAVPQVIFLDLNMPGMDGWEFLEALAPYEKQLAGRCRIYILTSSLALADTAKAKEYSLVSGLLHKPIDGAELSAIRAQIVDDEG